MEHFVSRTCSGESCGPCRRQGTHTPATHKVGEEFAEDFRAPIAYSHPLTQYVCCQHFREIMGMAVTQWRGCPDGTL